MAGYQRISADGHLEIPVERFESYIPEKHRDKAPQLVTKDDGTNWWQMDEWERDAVGQLVGDLSYDEFVPPLGARYFDFDGGPRPGTGDAVQRLREQDRDGNDAEILFPPVMVRAFLRLLATKDVDAYKAIVSAYNTYLAEEFCSVAPDRLIGMAMVPETGVDDAIAEMERCKELGLIAVSPRTYPNGGDGYDRDDDRFFAAAIDLDMKLAPHATLAPAFERAKVKVDKRFVFRMGSNFGGCMTVIGDLLNEGVFDRYPDLRLYFAETQAGWLAHSLNWADEYYLRWYPYHDAKISKLPSEYVREHCRFSFITDRLAMKLRYYIGVDVLMWGSDFPHSVGTYPYSTEVLEELFDGVPENERYQVLAGNAIEFFGLDPNQELTPTPA